MATNTLNLLRIEDINWKAVEAALISERLNARMARERFAPAITAATFKRWMITSLSERYSIDWGRQGRNNYIRLMPKATHDLLVATMYTLIREHGLTVVLRSIATATER
jgi:hypothetical protein